MQLRVQQNTLAHTTYTPTPLLPCTNCSRWNKTCTVEWIRSREKRRPWSKSDVVHQQIPELVYNAYAVPLPWYPNDIALQSNECTGEHAFLGDVSQSYSIGLQSPFSGDPSVSVTSFPYSTDESIVYQAADPDQYVVPSLSRNANGYSTHPTNDNERRYLDDPDAQQDHEDQILGTLPSISSSRRRHTPDHWRKRIDGFQQSSVAFIGDIERSRSPSPFTAHVLAEDWNRLAIKKGLLKIYHDSMEGALSCWLTERNCPYSSAVFREGSEVWGSSWANRIVTRVCALDKVYAATGALTTKDQLQAAKVLNLMVMAFASQWSQTGQRSNARIPTSPTTSPPSNLCSVHPLYGESDPQQSMEDDVFGRDMQKSLWHQAKRAICEASDNVSFRVIFAGIIFVLVQRPMDGAEVLRELRSDEETDLTDLFKILDLDGAPIWLDISLRKLLDHQRRMKEDREAAIRNTQDAARPALKLSGVHKETFGLLCWLGVMFDTLSAAMNRRSFAVNDTDSDFSSNSSNPKPYAQLNSTPADLDGWFDLSSDEGDALHEPGVDIWGDYFLHQHSHAGDARKQNIRWPCTYDDAASCLADAAPVKVLLFRRVAHLQDLSYRHTSGIEVEKALEAVMAVYMHWNETYGRFIDDCIRHHEALPPRIQSWYILLAGHWNLAVLIASDVIQKLDDAGMSLTSKRRGREAIEFTQTLRTRAAVAVSELGRCSHYGIEALSFSQSPEFHHAVNKAALLTEPWTGVLVRAFGHAGAFLARQVVPKSAIPALIPDALAAKTRVQYCINALWLLGKKSDMALCAAEILRQAIM